MESSQLPELHQDRLVLSVIASDILRRAGGENGLVSFVTQMLRECIDGVINTPKTARRSYEELEKTEKTYIGTCVEIAFRSGLKLKRGKLDLVVAGHDVDVKMTMGGSWMIPMEAWNQTCVLISANEATARCSLGLVIARREYLSAGENRDRKRTIAAAARHNIWWLLRDEAYPPNFWRTVKPVVVERVFEGESGNDRMVALFREVLDTPISRKVVEAVAGQKDFTRRVRADGKRGTRGRLAEEGIVLLSGTYDTKVISALGLPAILRTDYISHKLRSEDERRAARVAGLRL